VFEKAFLLGWSQTSEQEPDADEINKGLRGAGEPFIVFAEAPLPSQSGKGALDHPASRDHVEPGRLAVAQIGEHVRRLALHLPIGWINDLHRPAIFLGRPTHQRPGVALIGPNVLVLQACKRG
jgi:hypothetical protein